jgi:ABC-type phosphate transport system substrate-binding protein
MNARTLALVFGASAVVFSSGVARAANPPCNAIPLPDGGTTPTVYVGGSTAAQPFVQAIAQALLLASNPVTIVYKGVGSCAGVDGLLTGTTRMGTPTSTTATYWDATGALTCDLPVDGSSNYPLVDVGVSDVFASTCYPLPNGLPTNLVDFAGPVQTMTFVVPAASKQTSISARGAYFVFGFGDASGVAPWTDSTLMFRRNPTSGTQSMTAAAIGVPVAKWKGVDAKSAGGVLTGVGASSTNPEGTIGILALTDIPTDNTTIKVLAYQHYDQTCGYYPDSSPGARDKQNVRDGHYAIWGPLHFIVDTTRANFTDSKRVVNYLIGATAPPGGIDLIGLEAKKNVIPSCAMHVKRDSEVGALQSFAPTNSCSCYFDSVVGKTPSCKVCQGPQDCPSSAPNCSFGYCETQ